MKTATGTTGNGLDYITTTPGYRAECVLKFITSHVTAVTHDHTSDFSLHPFRIAVGWRRHGVSGCVREDGSTGAGRATPMDGRDRESLPRAGN
jgi:hypothetical protein